MGKTNDKGTEFDVSKILQSVLYSDLESKV